VHAGISEGIRFASKGSFYSRYSGFTKSSVPFVSYQGWPSEALLARRYVSITHYLQGQYQETSRLVAHSTQVSVSIGRGESSDIVIDAVEVSKHHCTIEVHPPAAPSPSRGRSAKATRSSSAPSGTSTDGSEGALRVVLRDHSRNGTHVIVSNVLPATI